MICNENPIEVIIEHDELVKNFKVKQIASLLSKKHQYHYSLTNKTTLKMKGFRSQAAAQRIESYVRDILGDMCELPTDSDSSTCSDLYNCCSCGGANCGCAYCFDCNACDHCLSDS